jgi:hypothetical protein
MSSMISLVRVNSSSFLRSKRRIIGPRFEALKEKRIIGEDVGLKAGGQIDSAERSLAGIVASLFIAASVREPATR